MRRTGYLMAVSVLLASIVLSPLAPFGGSARALMIEVSMDQMVEQSTEILRGRVMSMRSQWTPDERTIMTHVTLYVAESWTGEHKEGESITVSVEGGVVGEIGVFVEDEPVFTPGEEVVLFLRANEAGALEVNAAAQGKYTVAGELVVGFDHQPRSLAGFRSDVQRTIREKKP